ncbi:Hsp20/alpha crystallin family protein [Vagococcus elongatus]|uniref:Uncharacterized protein n=1 Tax=Vagococcus elongatus TaxID=180344 RepID=A0A430B4V0_9ENTE|nr:Hsp20/alpha crystallin family protein [Vagococcus elongatus]RSU15281.1 hypothetical protein CBF29_02815 [Vagococcus elongatus]
MVHNLMKRDFDDFIPDDFFGNFGKNFFKSFAGDSVMKTDISETDEAYTVNIDMPGLNKKDIKIDFKDDILSVDAKREVSTEEKDEKGSVIRSERHYGSFNRSFHLPNVKQTKVTAKYENGELIIKLPKEEKTSSGSNILID